MFLAGYTVTESSIVMSATHMYVTASLLFVQLFASH